MLRWFPAPGSIWAEDTSIELDSCPRHTSGDHAPKDGALLLRLPEVVGEPLVFLLRGECEVDDCEFVQSGELLHAFEQPGEGLLCCLKVLSSLSGRQLRSPVSHLRSLHGFLRLQLGCLSNSELRFR